MSEATDDSAHPATTVTLYFRAWGDGVVEFARASEGDPFGDKRRTVFNPRRVMARRSTEHWAQLLDLADPKRSPPGPRASRDVGLLALLGVAKGETLDEAWCDLRDLATLDDWPKTAREIGDIAMKWLSRNPSEGMARYEKGSGVDREAARATFARRVVVRFRPSLPQNGSAITQVREWLDANLRQSSTNEPIRPDPRVPDAISRQPRASVDRASDRSSRLFESDDYRAQLLAYEAVKILQIRIASVLVDQWPSQARDDEFNRLIAELDTARAEYEKALDRWMDDLRRSLSSAPIGRTSE